MSSLANRALEALRRSLAMARRGLAVTSLLMGLGYRPAAG